MTTRQQGPCKNMQNKIHFFCFSPFWKSWINLSKWVGKTNFFFSMFHAIFVAVVTWNIESWCSKRRETIFVPVSRGKHGFLWKGNRLTWSQAWDEDNSESPTGIEPWPPGAGTLSTELQELLGTQNCLCPTFVLHYLSSTKKPCF